MRNHWKTTEMEAILQSSYSSVPNNKWGGRVENTAKLQYNSKEYH